RRWTVKAWLLILLLSIVRPQSVGATPSQYSIQFKEQLKIPNDLKLTGGQSVLSVSFKCEATWKPAPGSALHLFIYHSPDMDANRSFLSVSLNYGVLRSLRLDEDNQSTTEVLSRFHRRC